MPFDSGAPRNPTVKIGGQQISAAMGENLIDLRVSLRLALPAEFSLRFRDRDFELFDGSEINLGDAVDILLPEASGSETSVFTGEVTAIGVDQGAGQTHELVVSGTDLGHRLTHAKAHRTYLNMGADAIVGQIAGRAGLAAKSSAGGDPFEHLIQADTDQRFLDHLARLCGCSWWVEGNDLHFAKPAEGSAVTLTWGDDLRRFKVRMSTANQTGKVAVRGWDPDTQAVITADDKKAAHSPSSLQLGADSPAATALSTARKALRDFSGGSVATATVPLTVKEGERLAAAHAEEHVSGAITGRGEALGQPDLRPGGWVQIDNMGASLSGNYALTEVEHVWGAGSGLLTRFSIGPRRPDRLVDLLGAGTVPGGPLGDRDAVTNNALLGVVTNINDPDKTNRVKVRFGVLDDQMESTWARVVAPGAGNQAGLALHPAVGDEVLVLFERGDLRRPLVVGGLWSKKQTQPGPTNAEGKITKGVLRSRKGHQLEIGEGDKDEEAHISLLLKNGTVLRVGQDKVAVDVKKGPFSITVGNGSIVISDQGDITIAGKNVTVKATQKLALSGQAGAELSSQQATKVSGAAQAELSASGSVKVSGGGIVEVAGSLVKLG